MASVHILIQKSVFSNLKTAALIFRQKGVDLLL